MGFLVATVGAVAVVAPIERLSYLIPVILIAGPSIGVAITATVAWMNIKKPQNLMLGQISGDEYVAIETRVILGDSEHGERAVIIPEPQSTVIDGNMLSIPPLAAESPPDVVDGQSPQQGEAGAP